MMFYDFPKSLDAFRRRKKERRRQGACAPAAALVRLAPAHWILDSVHGHKDSVLAIIGIELRKSLGNRLSLFRFGVDNLTPEKVIEVGVAMIPEGLEICRDVLRSDASTQGGYFGITDNVFPFARIAIVFTAHNDFADVVLWHGLTP